MRRRRRDVFGRRFFFGEANVTRCLLGLGSNAGDRDKLLQNAVQCISDIGRVHRVACSGFHPTRAVGGPADQPEFLNAAVVCESTLAPGTLLTELQRIEAELGRERTVRWGARTIDIDLLLYGQRVVRRPDLVVPHPRMTFRRFVLQPAAEIASTMVHPLTHWTIQQLLDRLNETNCYVAVTGDDYATRAAWVQEAARRLGCRLIVDPAPASSTAPAIRASLLQRRDALTACPAPRGRCSPSAFVLSDFWIGESLAERRCHDRRERLQGWAAAWRSVPAWCKQPKLLVVVTGGPASPTGVERSSAPFDDALLRQARRRRQCPVLELDATMSAGECIDELVAAIEAMQ